MSEENENDVESPPLFKTWTGWYTLVIGTLVFLIGLFYSFTVAFK